MADGEWRITEHHSSAMPEAQPEGVAEMFDKWNAALQVGGWVGGARLAGSYAWALENGATSMRKLLSARMHPNICITLTLGTRPRRCLSTV